MKRKLDLSGLSTALSRLFGQPARVLSATPYDDASTYSCDVLKCDIQGKQIEIFAKHGVGQPVDRLLGHSFGLDYEFRIYQRILPNLDVGTARFFGTATIDDETWGFLELLAGGEWVSASPNGNGVVRAAEWLAEFHHKADRWLAGTSESALRGATRDTYTDLLAKARERAARLTSDITAVGKLFERLGDFPDAMVSSDQTVVHGEFYPGNIVLKGDRVCPIDWESAAVAPAEIDLASLIEAWPSHVALRCIEAYRRGRGLERSGSGFQTSLTRCRIYWALRWLISKPPRGARRRLRDLMALQHCRLATKD